MSSVATQLEVLPLSRMFKALGDETRVRIIALLSHGELCVCHVEEALSLSQPTASRQLAVLRHAGLIDQRRRGNWVYYRLAEQLDPQRRRLLRTLAREFAGQATLAADLERLMRKRGPKACR